MNTEPLVAAVSRLGDLMSEDIEMRKREALSGRAREDQTAVERYARRHSDDRPHQFSFLSFARALPGFLDQFVTEIPGEFWNEDDGQAVVACPCGGTPIVPFNAIRACECERFFAFTGRTVRVANSPKGREETAVVD
jgi:hypothetical protein